MKAKPRQQMRSGMNIKMAWVHNPRSQLFPQGFEEIQSLGRSETGRKQGFCEPRKWDDLKRLVLCVRLQSPALRRSLATTLVSSRPVWHSVSKRKKEKKKEEKK